ncbi:universal stress protein [Botryobacter ruber]|uniref:universal stress protein n=1 Tax=Botryobacter ruber TaxID=2171629 RepID=UPI000E0B3A62|nr:universal stress protein [Botryobacter ruber]
MNTILVPVDYSNACLKALEVALNLASRLNGQVLLCHIYHPPVFVEAEEDIEDDPEALAMEEAGTKQEALVKLRDFAQLVKANSPEQVPVGFTVQAGNVVEELQKLIKDKAVTMVVLGSRKQTSILNKVFGTTTEKLLKEATCPVLAVPESAQSNPFGRVVYATALEPYEENALRILVQAKNQYNSTIAVLYVENTGLQEAIDVDGRKKSLLKEFSQQQLIFSQVKSKDVAKGIEDYVQSFNADLVAFTVSHHTFWQDLFKSSVTSRLLHELDLPLLAFPINTPPINFGLAEDREVVP